MTCRRSGPVERLAERFVRQLAGHSERSEEGSSLALAIIASTRTSKEEFLQRLRHLHAEGLSLQKIADRLNAKGVPTLSSKRHSQKGTIGNLLAQEAK
jgi:Recombinase